jgi:hypothetical protein
LESVINAIRKRTSQRQYSKEYIDTDKKRKLKNFIESNTQGPFGNQVRFRLLDNAEFGGVEVIRGSREYIVGAMTKGYRSMEDFGYCMEKIFSWRPS